MARSLQALDPSEFEHLLFDLLRTMGMRNLVWRTPGADGGRDLEGHFVDTDFSGQLTAQVWYIEAKKYADSVDWPTVWKKLSYAESANAQYLLMATTSSFSPRCSDEISRWNAAKRYPQIRTWPSSEIAFRIRLEPSIALKYGLVDVAANDVPALALLAQHLAKINIVAMECDLSGPDKVVLECSSAMSELLLIRSEDLARYAKIVRRSPTANEAWYKWFHIIPGTDVSEIDTPGLRALISTVAFVTRPTSIEFGNGGPGYFTINPKGCRRPDLMRAKNLFDTIALWADFELTIRSDSVDLNLRTGI